MILDGILIDAVCRLEQSVSGREGRNNNKPGIQGKIDAWICKELHGMAPSMLFRQTLLSTLI